MTDMIKVRTPSGRIQINPDQFFPAKSSDVRKLCRAVIEGGRVERPDTAGATINMLIERCREKLVKVEKCRKKYRAIYEESINYKETSLYDGLYYSKRAIAAGYVLLQIDRDAKKLESNLDILEGAYNGTD